MIRPDSIRCHRTMHKGRLIASVHRPEWKNLKIECPEPGLRARTTGGSETRLMPDLVCRCISAIRDAAGKTVRLNRMVARAVRTGCAIVRRCRRSSAVRYCRASSLICVMGWLSAGPSAYGPFTHQPPPPQSFNSTPPQGATDSIAVSYRRSAPLAGERWAAEHVFCR